MGDLDGKVAIVTGAGRLRGIGRASAVALAMLGANVTITGTGRDPSTYPDDEKLANWRDIESTAEQVTAAGSKCLTVVTDITNSKDVQRMVDRTLDEFGRVDILINNAAFTRGPDRVPVVDMDDSIFRRVLDIKIMGTYLASKAVGNVLINQAQGGKIINVSSAASKRGLANTSAYNAANFAINGFTQALAKELGPYGVNVNAVCPGFVETSRMDGLSREDVTGIGIRRIGTDQEVGEFIAYLCTNAAEWIHGQAININGGSIMEH